MPATATATISDRSGASRAAVINVTTSDTYAKIESANPGDEVVIAPGTYTFRMNIPVGKSLKVNIPIDVVVQPKKLRKDRLPILIEAKSAGDFTNTNKRRKEEATKIHQLQDSHGESVVFVLFLCGYFGGDYLGYEAVEGIDWVWEHRIDDLAKLGL